MRITKILLAALFVVSIFSPVQPVQADIAPPPAPQLGGLEPFEYQETNVQMVYERVEMEIQPFTQFDYDYTHAESRIQVTAYFTMRNNGISSESMQAIFPLESFTNCEEGSSMGNSYTYYQVISDSFEVIVDSNNIPIRKVFTKHPHKGCEQMSWAGFDIDFPVDEDVVIRVHYVMESSGMDSIQNIEYILETGAGWAGPIERGYVVVKFPYIATTENVLSESTSGYQFLYNEIFWSFENLEPTSEDNIQVSVVSPDTWQKILSIKRNLKQNPKLPEEWLKLAQAYLDISTWHGDNVRSYEYYMKIFTTYEKGISENTDSAELYAKYAEFQLMSWSPRLIRQITDDEASSVVSLLNKAFALDLNNETARMTLLNLQSVAPSITFTPPATIPSTATSPYTATPSITPSATITSIPSETPFVVTVVHTKLVKAPTSTPDLDPALTIYPTLTETPIKPQTESGSSSLVLGALVIFAVGAGSGWLLSKRPKK